MQDMKISLDYQRISKICQTLVQALAIKIEGKDVYKLVNHEMFKLNYLVCSLKSFSVETMLKGILSESLTMRRLVTSSLYLNTLFNP